MIENNNPFSREMSLIGEQNYEKLKNARVAVFGLGGVGSYAVEALARAGVGHLFICDYKEVAPHNINRQLFALHSTLGRKKTEVAYERLKDINPNIDIDARFMRYDSDTCVTVDLKSYDYVIDCVDLVTHKLLLAQKSQELGFPLISCMSTGNKLNCDFVVADIFSTKICPLCNYMRPELRKKGVKKLKVLYSEEVPQKPQFKDPDEPRRQTASSISFVPATAGIMLAGYVIKELIK